MLDTDTRAKLRSLLPQVLARRLNEAGAELGTTFYCLHVYLLQKLYLVPLGYRFKLYPEGPQCDEVLVLQRLFLQSRAIFANNSNLTT